MQGASSLAPLLRVESRHSLPTEMLVSISMLRARIMGSGQIQADIYLTISEIASKLWGKKVD